MEEVEEMSVAELLFSEDFELYTERIPLRPVGPSVSTCIIKKVKK